MKLRNKYYIMRHGQAISNVKALCSSWPEKFHNPLTRLGKQLVKESAEKLRNKNINIDFIIHSPLLRTEQTAGIVSKVFKVKIKKDKRLREIGFGKYSGGPLGAMWKSFKKEEERINKGSDGGETYKEVLTRIFDLLKSIDKKYKGRTILLVSHECPLFLLQGKVMGLSIKETIEKFSLGVRIHKAEIRELN